MRRLLIFGLIAIVAGATVVMALAQQSRHGRNRGAEEGAVPVVAAAAHTLKGSARGIGAWRVANTAEALELAAPGPAGQFKAALGKLDVAVAETKVAIADLLRAN